MYVENFVSHMANEKFRPKQFHAGFNFYLIYFHFHVWFSFPLVIFCLYIRKIIITWYFYYYFYIGIKQYVYMYIYVLDLQRCTEGIQRYTGICLHKDTETQFDILYRE